MKSDYSHSPVVSVESRGFISLLAVFMAFCINIASILLGAKLGMQANFNSIILGALGGGFTLFIVAGCMGAIGAQTKFSTAMISTFTFGRKGSVIVSLILAISLLGWFGVQTEIFAQTVAHLISAYFGISISHLVAVICGGVLMSSTAIIGFCALEVLSLTAVPLLLIILTLPFLMGAIPLSSILNTPVLPDSMGVATIISLVVGGWIAGAVIMPDITRFARSKKSAAGIALVGFIVAYPLIILMSALFSLHTQETDFVSIMLALGLGAPALFVIILATWTTNDSNLYTSSLSLAAVFRNTPKWKLASAAGALGTILATMGILSYFIPWLIILGITIALIGGTIIGDYFYNPSRYIPENIVKQTQQFKWLEVCVWACGCGVGYLSSEGILSITAVAPLDGLLTSAIVIFVLQKIKRS